MGLKYEAKYPILKWITVGDVIYDEGIAVVTSSFDEIRESGKRPWHILASLLQSTENRTEDELRGIAETIATRKGLLSGKLAVVVRQPLIYGVTKMFAVFMSEYDIVVKIFATEESAEQWLLES